MTKTPLSDARAAFTIAICTHNRAAHLRRCLDGLTKQRDGACLTTVLVVDNASTDATVSVASEFRDRLCLHIIAEPKIGLSHARNTALAHAETEYLVFLDDDAIPLPDWTTAIEDGIEKWRPDVFGGPYIPHYLTPKPEWFLDRLGSTHLGMREELASHGYCFTGANMGWRTTLLREAGGFNPALGMIGAELRLGEETALQLQLWKTQPTLRRVKLPQMLVTHFVAPEKMELAYIWQRAFTYGRQLGQINPDDPLWKHASCLRALLESRLGLPLAARCARDTVLGREDWKRYAADWAGRFGVHFGAAYERRAL